MAYIICPFVERLSLSPTAYSQIVAQQRAMPKCTIIVSQHVAFLSNVFSVLFHWMRPCNVHCWRSSCLDLVTAHAIIPQLISDPVSHTHQVPRVALLAKYPCYSSTCSVYNILSQVGRFCLQAHTTHVMPAEPSAFSHVVHTVGIYTHFVWRDSN